MSMLMLNRERCSTILCFIVAKSVNTIAFVFEFDDM